MEMAWDDARSVSEPLYRIIRDSLRVKTACK